MLPGSGCNLQQHVFMPLPEGDEIRFLFIGRVMKLKGIDQYLQAAEIVKKSIQIQSSTLQVGMSSWSI